MNSNALTTKRKSQKDRGRDEGKKQGETGRKRQIAREGEPVLIRVNGYWFPTLATSKINSSKCFLCDITSCSSYNVYANSSS